MGILKSYNESRLTKKEFGPGGNPGSSLPTAVKSRIDDLSRMTQIIASGNGLKFISNNAKLNQITSDNRIIDAAKQGKLFSKENLSALKDSIIEQGADTAKLIGSTLAQVPLNGTGTHLVHKFRTETYSDKVGEPRKSALAEEGDYLAKKDGDPLQDLSNLKFRENYPYIPNSTVGESYVKDSEENVESNYPQTEEKLADKSGNEVLRGKDLSDNSFDTDVKRLSTSHQIVLQKPTKRKQPQKQDRINIKYKIGDPTNSNNSSDQINLSDTIKTGDELLDYSGNPDLAQLRFKVITPEEERYIQLRAYITSFGDSFTGNWNSYNYIGRGEKFYTYNDFDRSINLGFKVFAQSGEEMRPVYKKIDLLASTTAPTYNKNGYMRGTLVRLTVGGYLKNLPGFISSVNYTINQDDQWDVGSDYTNNQSVPMSMDCTVNFTPIHTFTPVTAGQEKGDENRFIAPLIKYRPNVEVGEGEFTFPDEAHTGGLPTVPDPEPDLERYYSNGLTVEYDPVTKRTVRINGQNVERSQGGWVYTSDKRPALITQVDGL